MIKEKSIIITGTHHTPAIEIIKQLQKDKNTSWNIHYISHNTGRDTHLTNTIIPLFKANYHEIACGKFHRRSVFDSLIGIPSTIIGFFQSLYLVHQIKPDIVISFGGYVSVPVIIAAKINNIPSITHEQTLTVSLATKINAMFSTKVALTFAETNSKDIISPHKVVITGNPIRTEIFKKTSPKYSFLDMTIKKRPLIYITGGSQGSEFINQLIVEILPKLSTFTIIHQTGIADFANIKEITSKLKLNNYFPVEYVDYDNIGWVLNNADIIIGRSGANNCLDLHVLNKKAILIPLFFAQQNEQLLNAKWLQNIHPHHVIICEQANTSSQVLLNSINQLHLVKTIFKVITPPAIDPLFKLINEISN